MKYQYLGLKGHINKVLDELNKENISWEYAERNNEFIINSFSCDIPPKDMSTYMDNALVRYSKLLPIPKKVFRTNTVDSTIIAHNCDFAYIRQNENDTEIVDSEKLHPGKFTTEFYKEWGEKLYQEHLKTATDTDLIYGLEGTLDNIKFLKTVKTKEQYNDIYNEIIRSIEEDIKILKLRNKNNNIK